MSLQIMSQPYSDPLTALLSAGNDNITTLSGSTFGAANVFEYKYICDVIINWQIVATLKSFPDPTFGFGVFNTRNIASSFVTYDFFPQNVVPTNMYNNCPNSSVKIGLQFGEEYVSGSTFIQTRNIISGNTLPYINASLSFIDQNNLSLSGYTAPLGTGLNFNGTNKWLHKPIMKRFIGDGKQYQSFVAYTNQRRFLSVVNGPVQGGGTGHPNTNVLAHIFITTFDANGAQVGLYITTHHAGSPDPNLTTLMTVGVGYPQIAALLNFGAFTSYNQPDGFYSTFSGPSTIFNASVAYYQIQGITGLDTGWTVWVPVMFQIVQDCGRFANTAYNVYWLNEFGVFDCWFFNKKNETTQTKSTQTYKKTYGNLQSNGVYQITTYNKNRQPYFTVLEDTITLTTDFLTDDEVLYLKPLISSPVVFLEDQNGLITAITIEDNSYRINKKVNQKIYSLTMNIKQAYNDYRQNA